LLSGFGGFSPVEWENECSFKADASLKSFLFALKNPHNVPARRFALKAEKKDDIDFHQHQVVRPSGFRLTMKGIPSAAS
jgi:hypothetical protein